jgi:hypothetical protein
VGVTVYGRLSAFHVFMRITPSPDLSPFEGERKWARSRPFVWFVRFVVNFHDEPHALCRPLAPT